MKTRTLLVAVALGAACAGPSGRACIQGVHFHPAKPTALRPPPIVAALSPEKPQLALPGLAPIGLPGLTAAETAAAPAPKMPDAGDDERAEFERYARAHEARPAGTATADETTDYAVALLRLGRIAEAIAVLEALEAATPGRYATAANLGTAYELAGRVAEALTWITRGLALNPAAHQGTEWLHAAILRAKLRAQENPEWFARHGVLHGERPRAPAEVLRAIDHQLSERLVFVRPEDAVVCDLYFEAARSVTGETAALQREIYARESRRFGAWRVAQLAELARL